MITHVPSLPCIAQSDLVIRPSVQIPQGRCDIPFDVRPADEREDERIRRFITKGCGCLINDDRNCSLLFPFSHYRLNRDSCAELELDSLDLVIMGQLMALTVNTDVILNKNRETQERQRTSTQYLHLGQKVNNFELN